MSPRSAIQNRLVPIRIFLLVLGADASLNVPALASIAMDPPTAARFAQIALDGIDREFPNKPGAVLASAADVVPPRAKHPVFYGHFDWHSSVHGHWTLVRLLRLYPGHALADESRRVLDGRLTEPDLAAEARYFETKENRSFERMYGWAWALRLATELRAFDDPDARRWAAAYTPLERTIVELAMDYLPKLDWPIRTGVHPDSGWALGQMLDYARAAEDAGLESLVTERARHYYGADRGYPVAYEPSGNDFFSSGLNEADLMRRVLAPAAFGDWLDGFFPGLADGEMGNLLAPATVTDITDGHLVHLAGLNFNRAWTMRGVASALPQGARKSVLEKAATEHLEAGLGYLGSGHYEGDHWLASFATYSLTAAGQPGPARDR
ncbi:DUF2891 domain-containing protein [soil metagenome]